MTDRCGDTSAPWIRLAGALIVGFALVDLATNAWFIALVERIQQLDDLDALPVDGADPYELREQAFRWLGLAGGASLGTALFGGWAVALTLVAAAWAASRRVPVAIAALGFAASTCSSLRMLAFQLQEPPHEPGSLSSWYQVAAAGHVVATGAVAALVLSRTRGRPRRSLALAGVAVAALSELPRLYGSFLGPDGTPPSWWSEPVLGLRLPGWASLLGALGLGVALWLASRPTDDQASDEAACFDTTAARGLRLARAAVWWRVALAVGSAALAIAGTMAMRRAQQAAFFGGGTGSTSAPWTLKAAPWLGYVEIGLGVLMVVGLSAVVVQRRSRAAAVLGGLGALALLATSMGSFALNQVLHESVIRVDSLYGFDLRRYAELTVELDPLLRGSGLLGLGCTLGGLLLLVRVIGGASPVRAIRFLTLAGLLTAGWLYGREGLDALGSGVLLLAPVVLGVAIWMLLDLTTFLREVAEALDGEPGSMPVEH